MSNMYGYNDYNGPENLNLNHFVVVPDSIKTISICNNDANNNEKDVDDDIDGTNVINGGNGQIYDDDDDDDMNPLQAGFWMEGDSLAPPCGTSIPVIHKLLEIAFDGGIINDNNDDCCLYDLGCGDGRICLEAYSKFHCCSYTVGIEIESDLVDRARFLVNQLDLQQQQQNMINNAGQKPSRRCLPQIVQMDLREALDCLINNSLMNPVQECSHESAGAHHINEKLQSSSIHENLPLPTIIILYLLPESLALIECQLIHLLELLPKLRIICSTWKLPNLSPSYEKEIITEENNISIPIYIYEKQSL